MNPPIQSLESIPLEFRLLAYLIIFLIFSGLSLVNSIRVNYSQWFIFSYFVSLLTLLVGLGLYYFHIEDPAIVFIWKFLFAFIALEHLVRWGYGVFVIQESFIGITSFWGMGGQTNLTAVWYELMIVSALTYPCFAMNYHVAFG